MHANPRNPTQDKVADLSAEMSGVVLDEVRRCNPDHRRLGHAVGWQRKAMLAGKIASAGALPRVLAEALCDGTPTDRITAPLYAVIDIIERERGEDADAVDVATEVLNDGPVNAEADQAERQVLVTRSEGDLDRLIATTRKHIRHQQRVVRAAVRAKQAIREQRRSLGLAG